MTFTALVPQPPPKLGTKQLKPGWHQAIVESQRTPRGPCAGMLSTLLWAGDGHGSESGSLGDGRMIERLGLEETSKITWFQPPCCHKKEQTKSHSFHKNKIKTHNPCLDPELQSLFLLKLCYQHLLQEAREALLWDLPIQTICRVDEVPGEGVIAAKNLWPSHVTQLTRHRNSLLSKMTFSHMLSYLHCRYPMHPRFLPLLPNYNFYSFR